jgi:argininosuccinate synthase
VPVEQTKANLYSRDRNIWHLSHEGGVLEDPTNAPEESMWQWVLSPEKASSTPADVEIGFEQGTPVSVNGRKLSPVALIDELNALGAAHGVGRIDLLENRLIGMKSRGAYETPGGTLLVLAHRELETLCVDRETAHYAQMLSLRYAELVYYGLWFTELRRAMDAFFSTMQERVSGSVGLRLYKGNVLVTHRKSEHSLYKKDLASFSMAHYNPKDAEGFINLFALPVTAAATARAARDSGK